LRLHTTELSLVHKTDEKISTDLSNWIDGEPQSI